MDLGGAQLLHVIWNNVLFKSFLVLKVIEKEEKKHRATSIPSVAYWLYLRKYYK